MNSFIVAFYGTDDTRDSSGRTFNDLMRYNNQALEYSHDYIQILFPLPEPSPVNPRASTITASVRATFLEHSGLRERLVLAFDRMLQFYGFGLNPRYSREDLANLVAKPEPTPPEDIDVLPTGDELDDPAALIGRGANFSRRASVTWLKRRDHNHLRITRIIRCLRVLGLEVLAEQFHGVLLANDPEGVVSADSRKYWRRAAERGLWLAPHEEDDEQGVAWLRREFEEDGDGAEQAEGEAEVKVEKEVKREKE